MSATKHGAAGGHFTYEDLLHTPDDGKRYEVLEGDLIVSPSAKVKHQEIVLRLTRLLDQADRAARGRLLMAPVDVVLSDRDVVQPDLLFIAADRLEIVAEDNVKGVPDLVVEVISEGSRHRDVITKRHIYERHGVRFYWIVDPEEETVRVFELQEGTYGDCRVLRAGQELGCALFRGVTQDVGQLFSAH